MSSVEQKIENLHVTQPYLIKTSLDYVASHVPEKPPCVYKIGEQSFLWDGHHRAFKNHELNDPMLFAEVTDVTHIPDLAECVLRAAERCKRFGVESVSDLRGMIASTRAELPNMLRQAQQRSY